jgi:hypothetical protein
MSLKPLLLALALASSSAAMAQTPAASTPAKKALVAKILALQQPAIEGLARQLVEQPAVQMLQQAGGALQRVPADKREQVAKDMQADARKYAEEMTPMVRDRAIKLAPTTIGALLEEKFTEDELKQIVAILESPVNKKFGALGPEMQKQLSEKLVADSRGIVEPKVKALEQSFVKRLEAPLAGASAPK